MNLLEIQCLKGYFPAAKDYLHTMDDISFAIEEDTTLGVVGGSSYDKSTLRRLILRLLNSARGEVYYRGDSILACDKHKMRMMRQRVQIIFQNPYESLNLRVSMGEIISGTLIINKPYWSKTELNDKIYELMETAGLVERLVNPYPHELDGNRRQRIGTARALVLNPGFIICDEPVSALDVSIQVQILDLMQDFQEQKGLTYMFITHNLGVIERISDNIMIMYLGQVVEFAPKKLLFPHLFHPCTRALLATIPVLKLNSHNKQRGIIHGEIASPTSLGDECRFVKRYLFAEEVYFQIKPELVKTEPEHSVVCRECL